MNARSSHSGGFHRWMSAALLLIPALAGCETMPFVPGAQIGATQMHDQPNYTVQFTVADAVTDPASVTGVNWVFGDDMGFVSGGTVINHRYNATGSFDVTAYVFASDNLLGTLTRNITVFAGQQATAPNPSDGATGVALNASLSWTAGAGDPQHDIYFGTDSVAVGNATSASPEFQRRQSSTNFSPASLAGGTTYFWRIDEVTTASTTKGQVWSFSTISAPGPIANAVPADGATGVSLTIVLDWDAGSNAASHDVYFGTDQAAVTSAVTSSSEFRGNITVSQFDPVDLMADVQYFWRIDERGTGGVTKGATRSFRTEPLPGAATNHAPVNAATGIALDVVLTWDAGTNTTSHDVYFGTDETAVNDAGTNSALFRGNQGDTDFDPDNLLAGINYFWRIDEVNSAGKTKGSVRRFRTAPAPGAATDPEPEDDALAVSLTPTLTWDAGTNTTSHDVYFGDSFAEVNNATTNSPEFQMNQPGTMFAVAGPLGMNTEYFWRIDERGPGGVNKGTVFSFTSFDNRAASDPDPAHDEDDVATNSVLTWTAGVGSMTHNVYLGTSENGVRDANTSSASIFRGNVAGAMYAPPSLDPGVEYFWRVDEVGMDETIKGVVWSFATAPTPPDKAEDPNPIIGATNIGITPTLSWTAGDRATSHDVYFGTDMNAVMNANHSSAGIFRGNRTTANFNPGTLTRAVTHYWRIDEVNDAGTTAGDLWSFTTIPEIPTKISNPSPVDGSQNRNINAPDPNQTVLGWTTGTGTGPISHDVYFGTDQAGVTNATHASALFMGNQPGVTFNPGVLTAFTTYYWRIDEVNAGGTRKGDVTSFTTAPTPVAASLPSPADTVLNVALPVMLSWTSDMAVTGHDVYFGTNQGSVMSATRTSNPQFRGTLAAGNTIFGDAMGETFGVPIIGVGQYFWRIDEVGPGGINRGAVWSFVTAQQAPGLPSNPQPANGQQSVTTAANALSWTAVGADEYRVYYGTDQTMVTNKDMAVDQGPTTDPTITTAARAANTTYFWRVVATNAVGSTDGPVWSFKTQ